MSNNYKKVFRKKLYRFFLKLDNLLSNKKRFRSITRKSVLVLCSIIFLIVLSSYLRNSNASSPASADHDDNLTNSISLGEGIEPQNQNNTSNTGNENPEGTPVLPPNLRSKLVVIDPGHGGIDPGTDSEELGVYEKDIVLDIALKTGKILEELGANVLLTRTDDTFMKPSEKIGFANERGAALFVSLHCDAFEDDNSVRGITTFYYPKDYSASGNLSGKEYAKIVHSELVNVVTTKDRGAVSRKNLIVLNSAKMPSILIELGFISNIDDAKMLTSDEMQEKIAKALADGIIKALERLDSEDATEDTPSGS